MQLSSNLNQFQNNSQCNQVSKCFFKVQNAITTRDITKDAIVGITYVLSTYVIPFNCISNM